MLQWGGEAAAGHGGARAGKFRGGPLRDHAAAAGARAGTQIDHAVGAANRVLVVFNDDQRVALAAQPVQGVEERRIVARVQADGGLVEHVAYALQIRSELRRQANALGLAAGERGSGAIQLQIAQPHVAEKSRARRQLGQQVAGDVALATGQFEFLEDRRELAYRKIGERGDRSIAEQHMKCDRIETLTPAIGTAGRLCRTGFPPSGLLAALLGVELLQLQSGAEAAHAPSMLRVEGEQPRVEFRKSGAAVGAGAFGGKDARRRRGDMHHTAPVLQRKLERLAQFGLARRADSQCGHGQFDVMLDEAIEPRPLRGRQQPAVDL